MKDQAISQYSGDFSSSGELQAHSFMTPESRLSASTTTCASFGRQIAISHDSEAFGPITRLRSRLPRPTLSTLFELLLIPSTYMAQ